MLNDFWQWELQKKIWKVMERRLYSKKLNDFLLKNYFKNKHQNLNLNNKIKIRQKAREKLAISHNMWTAMLK